MATLEQIENWQGRVNRETVRNQATHILMLEAALHYFMHCAEHGIAPDSARVKETKELIR